jgi:outer membrane receptor protein involved in Fe transport
MGSRSPHPSMNVSTTVSGILRALSICAPITLIDAAPTLAQSVVHTSLVADIPSRPLAEALAAFASQTGLQLVYVSAVVRHRTSHAAAAGLSVDEALAHLLEGTGLQFQYLTPYSVRIIAATAPGYAVSLNMNAPERDELREVIVTASRREEDQQDVPATIEVLTADTLAKLNATTFDDFISNLPGVTSHGVGPGQNNVFMRGLATNLSPIQAAWCNCMART